MKNTKTPNLSPSMRALGKTPDARNPCKPQPSITMGVELGTSGS